MMSDEQSDVASLQEPLLLPSPDVVVLQQQQQPPQEATTPMTGNHPSEGTSHQYQHRIVDGLTWDRSLLVKSLYFLDALGSSTWGRFSAIYYNLHGLNSQQIGMIEGLCTSIPMVSMVLWGIVSDHYHCRKQVWIGTKTVSTCILLLLALPYVFESFRRILVVSISAQLFVSSGILDAYTLELLGPQNKMYYGRYRLYASLSWGMGSIVMGWVTDHYGFDFNFVMFGLLSAMMIGLISTKIPETALQQHDEDADRNEGDTRNILQPQTQQSSIRNMGKIMDLVRLAFRPRVTIFLLEVVVMGAGMATVERLLFLYLVKDLNASTLLCGLSVGVNVLFELPIFWYASPIMKFFGHDGMFLLSMMCFVARLYGYTWLTPTTKWFILLLESMHGVTFATFWIVTTDVSKNLVETEGAFWSTAIPMCVQMLYSAVGVSVGSGLGGWAMHKYGSREMYTFTAACVLCMMMFHILGTILSRTCSSAGSFLPNFPHTSSDEESSVIDELTGDSISTSNEDDLAENGQEEDTQSQHLTSTEIIQIGSLIERESSDSSGVRPKQNSKRKGHFSFLIMCLLVPLASSVSGLTARYVNRQRSSTILQERQSTADIHSVNELSTKPKKKHKNAINGVQEVTEKERWHWKEDSDRVVVETSLPSNNAVTLGGKSKVSRISFTVRGNPRPLRRHRTSRGHMYNPSLKYQQSFQNVVDEMLLQTNSNHTSPLEAPIFTPKEHLVMTLIFRMKRPKNHFVNNKPGPDRLKKTAPAQISSIRTDVDNLTKFVLDSMNQVLYDDDRQVMSIHVTKLFDNIGTCEGSTEIYLRTVDGKDTNKDVEQILKNSIAISQTTEKSSLK